VISYSYLSSKMLSKVMVLLLWFLLLAFAQAFARCDVFKFRGFPVLFATGTEPSPSRHNFDLLIEYILKVFPEVLAPSKPMDASKVIENPRAWSKAKSGNGWRRAHAQDSQRLFHESDVRNDFLSRYVDSPAGGKSKGEKLAAMLDELDEMELLDSLDEYVKGEHTGNPLEVAEKFVAEGLSQSFAPIDRKMNKLKVEENARPYKKTVLLSEVRKVLKANPEYFK